MSSLAECYENLFVMEQTRRTISRKVFIKTQRPEGGRFDQRVQAVYILVQLFLLSLANDLRY